MGLRCLPKQIMLFVGYLRIYRRRKIVMQRAGGKDRIPHSLAKAWASEWDAVQIERNKLK